MAKNVSNLDKSLKQSITPADIGAAAASHGTHLTIGTGASNAAAGNHTHSNYATTTTIGSLSSLQTSNKSNLVAAINEVFQSGANVKQQLVDILVANGVNCSTSDSWNTLISYINENSSSGGLDIISATALPATGKENQICVITNSPTDKYTISSDIQDDNKTGIFCLTSNIPGIITYTSTSKNTTVKYSMLYFSQNNTIIPSYVYKNGNWTPLTNNRIFLLKDGVYVNEDIFGGLTRTETNGSYPVNYSAGAGIYGRPYSSYYTHFVSSVNRVNFANFNKVAVRLKIDTDQYNYDGNYFSYVFAWSTSKCVRGAYMSDAYYNYNYLTTTISPTNKSINMEKAYFTGTWNYYEIDISSWTNTDYLTILIGETTYCPSWYISDIYVY